MLRSKGFWTIFAVAVAIRLAYVFQIRGTPLTGLLLIDAETYHRFARMILAGTFRGEDVYSMNLGYPYFVAAVYALAAGSTFAVLLVQAVLGALNAGMIYALGRRLCDAPAAWVAGLAAAVYAPYVFFTGALLTPTLIDTLLLLALVSLAAWRGAQRARWLAAAGLAIGAATLGRGNALLWVALLPLFFRVETASWRRSLRPWAIVAAAALVLPVLATARNALVAGRLVPISANYAAFYIGHSPTANGLYAKPALAAGASFGDEVVGVREALSRELGRPLTQAEASRELLVRGLRWAAAHPREELSLAARKLYFFWNDTEAHTNLSFYIARDFSSLLRALPLGFGLVGALGLAGMLGARRRWRRHLLLHLAVAVPLVTCLVFFVSAEYRLPAVAGLLLFASVAVTRAAGWLRGWVLAGRAPAGPRPGRRGAARASARAVTAPPAEAWLALAHTPLLLAIGFVRTPLLRAQTRNRVAYYDYGVLAMQRGRLDQAKALLDQSLRIDPRFAPAHAALARLENRRGNTTAALRQIEAARGSASPNEPETEEDRLRIQAESLFQAGRYEEALAAFRRVHARYLELDRTAEATATANNIGLTLYRLGRLAEAERTLREIVAAEPLYVRAHTNLGLVLHAEKRDDEAIAEYRRALEIAPSNRSAQRALERLGVQPR